MYVSIMNDSEKGNETPQFRQNALKIAYEEVCRAHDGISDFRAKLLAFLPLASGTGIFLLLKLDNADIPTDQLLAIGIFGSLITFGLYLYELRGIQQCYTLTLCGEKIEKELLGSSKAKGMATFSDDPEAVFIVASKWAAWIIYPTIIGSWVYVALIGANLTTIYKFSLVGLTMLIFTTFGFLVWRMQKRLIKKQKELAKKDEC